MNYSHQNKPPRAREGRYSTDAQWEQYLEEPFLLASNPNTKLTSPYYRLDLPPEPSTSTEWPPSIRQHAEHLRYAPSSYSTLYSGPPPEIPLPKTPPHRTMTATPHSFYSRSLEKGFPEMQHGIDIYLDQQIPSILPTMAMQPVHDEFDETISFNNSDYSSSSLTSGSSVPDDDPTASFLSGPLRYHLIGTPLLPSLCKEPPQLQHPQHLHLHPTIPTYPPTPTTPRTPQPTHPDPQTPLRTAPCPLCPTKQYTGRYAAKNLARHMETEHTPVASPDGVRHIPCSQPGCERTFRRDDAKLVHERKSHPELMRSPAVKRKRGDE